MDTGLILALVRALAQGPDSTALATIRTALEQNPSLRKSMMKWVRDLVAELGPGLYPTSGRIAKSGTYTYLAIQDEGRYIARLSWVLQAIEQGAGMTALVKSFGGPAKTTYQVRGPPSNVDTHVAISQNIPASMIGQKVSFTLAPGSVISYADDRHGTKASGFDPRFYPLAWYVLYVDGLPPSLTQSYNDRPHISVAVLGWST